MIIDLKQEIKNRRIPNDITFVPARAVVHYAVFVDGQVVALEAIFPECPAKTIKLPYLRSLPDEVSLCADGKTLLHKRFGKGTAFACVVVFKNQIVPVTYSSSSLKKFMVSL